MHKQDSQTLWIIVSLALLASALFAIRCCTPILESGNIFDEKYIVQPINSIIEQGWSIETAIDFQETKGPAMIWPYAYFGKMLGGELNDLRFISVVSTLLSAFILLLLSVKSGCSRQQLLLVTLCWLLLPYNIICSQIVMGESSFLLLSLMTVAFALWGFQSTDKHSKWLAPILYGICLAIALHSRIHIVAVAGAVCITAYSITGKKSWPWWLASIIAGCLRVPLWIRWDGLVSPEYQSLHGLGIRLESLTYLAAALVPFLSLFIVQAWNRWSSRYYLISIFAFGVTLGLFASPSLFIPETLDFVNNSERFQGIVSSVARSLTTDQAVQSLVVAILAGIGLCGLASLWKLRSEGEHIVMLAFWTLFFGWSLYAFTRGFVFDRYMLTWTFLLPIIWVKKLSGPLLLIQLLGITLIAIWLSMSWFY